MSPYMAKIVGQEDFVSPEHIHQVAPEILRHRLLLSFEAAALILLFGAQVIAEFERCSPDADGGDDRFHT